MRRLKDPITLDSPHVDSLITLGRIVRARRLASGLRIDDAAALCDVSVDLMSRLENGHAGVSSVRLFRVFDALGLAMFVLDKESIPPALKAKRRNEAPSA